MLDHLAFADFMLTEDYQRGSLRREPVTTPFIGRFKIAALKKSY